MLNVINGFYHPNQGSITFKGQTRARMRPFEASRGGIARTFQNVALFKGMSTLDNIMTGRTLKMKRGLLSQALRIGPALNEELEHRLAVEKIIDFLEIQAWRKTPVGRLPYGLQKRVDLGRALAMDPRVLLLDEPFGALDAFTREQVQELLLTVWQRSAKPVFLITHDIEEAVFLATDLILLGARPGRIVERVALDFGRRYADGGVSARAIKSDPRFVATREYVLERVFAGQAAVSAEEEVAA